MSKLDEIKKISDLLRDGHLTEAEYNKLKQQIIGAFGNEDNITEKSKVTEEKFLKEPPPNIVEPLKEKVQTPKSENNDVTISNDVNNITLPHSTPSNRRFERYNSEQDEKSKTNRNVFFALGVTLLIIIASIFLINHFNIAQKNDAAIGIKNAKDSISNTDKTQTPPTQSQQTNLQSPNSNINELINIDDNSSVIKSIQGTYTGHYNWKTTENEPKFRQFKISFSGGQYDAWIFDSKDINALNQNTVKEPNWPSKPDVSGSFALSETQPYPNSKRKYRIIEFTSKVKALEYIEKTNALYQAIIFDESGLELVQHRLYDEHNVTLMKLDVSPMLKVGNMDKNNDALQAANNKPTVTIITDYIHATTQHEQPKVMFSILEYVGGNRPSAKIKFLTEDYNELSLNMSCPGPYSWCIRNNNMQDVGYLNYEETPKGIYIKILKNAQSTPYLKYFNLIEGAYNKKSPDPVPMGD